MEFEELAKEFLEEQVVGQRQKLNRWKSITNQTSQIDTGYIAQHIVSIVTGIQGSGHRGKGFDLTDGSEVKSANFLDAIDKPRWNFTFNKKDEIKHLLSRPNIYLLSIDKCPLQMERIRIWKINPRANHTFLHRYIEWVGKLAISKFEDKKRPCVNFQLFPPRNQTKETFARHGNNKRNGFPRLKIPLQNTHGSEIIFHAEINGQNVEIKELD